jgi:8-oxo-dGTP pyrophosphatase MutT (NUDIX family)
LGEFENFYIPMRETIEPNESVEQCLARGLMEEFGIEATLRAYLGTIISHYPMLSAGVTIEKTTLYFLCDLVSSDISKRKPDDPESDSEIFWLKPEELIIKMKEQGQRLNRSDIDESPALERLLQAN